MPRPFKNRNVNGVFHSNYFKPNGIPVSALSEIELSINELEALRLSDLENMYQLDAAEQMKVSRQTFGNIIKQARNKVADALVNGKALRIVGDGLSYSDAFRKCNTCGMGWRRRAKFQACPSCESDDQTIIEQTDEKQFFHASTKNNDKTSE